MILDTLSNKPGLGVGTTFFSTFISWLPHINPVLSFISLLIGISVGITTLYLQIRKIIK